MPQVPLCLPVWLLCRVKYSVNKDCQGYYNGGTPAIGYKVEKARVGAATKNVLVIDEEFAPIVQRVFDMDLSGKGAKEIVNILNRESIETNRGKP